MLLARPLRTSRGVSTQVFDRLFVLILSHRNPYDRPERRRASATAPVTSARYSQPLRPARAPPPLAAAALGADAADEHAVFDHLEVMFAAHSLADAF